MTADIQSKSYVSETVLYMAMELSNKQWRLAFGDGTQQRQVVIEAGDIAALLGQIEKVKAKWDLASDSRVVSCYEAGRDGFWLHRQLSALGIGNDVVDAVLSLGLFHREVTRLIRSRSSPHSHIDAPGGITLKDGALREDRDLRGQ